MPHELVDFHHFSGFGDSYPRAIAGPLRSTLNWFFALERSQLHRLALFLIFSVYALGNFDLHHPAFDSGLRESDSLALCIGSRRELQGHFGIRPD